MVKTKWDSFSTEQLKEILLNSNTFSEVQRKIGYKYHTSRNKKIKDLANIYDIDISHYGSLENLSGRFFNNLEVIDYNNEKSKENHRPYWNCQCTCGNKIVAKGMLLKNGTKKSCGCLNSSGNYQIQQLLKSLNLSYKSEYSFDDLKDKNKLRFDFAVFKNNKLKFLIEYNGKQHYEPVPFFGGEKTFLEQCYKDFLKKEYCKQNHIPLIVFKYNEEVNVSNLLSKIEEVEDNV